MYNAHRPGERRRKKETGKKGEKGGKNEDKERNREKTVGKTEKAWISEVHTGRAACACARRGTRMGTRIEEGNGGKKRQRGRIERQREVGS